MLYKRMLTTGCFVACFMVGCSEKTATNPKPSGGTAEQPHVHGEHGGELFQIVDAGHYIEMIHDGEKVTIYLLDKTHEKPAPIAASSVTIHMTSNATPVDFRLAAAPQPSDPEGKSSKFESEEKALDLALDNEQAEREIVIAIDGKTYRQKFEHFDDEHHHHHGKPGEGAENH